MAAFSRLDRVRAALPVAGRRWAFAAALLAAGAAPASASGSFGCTVDDAAVAFTAEGVFSHGMGEVFSNFRAELTLKPKGQAKAVGPLALDGEALAHHWMSGGELKLRLYHEAAGESQASIDLVVETRRRPSDETTFTGRYRLTLSGAGAADGKERVLKGRITCSVG